jgi:hypothetical protein
MYGDFEILSGNTMVHDDFRKITHSMAGVIDVVDQQHLVAVTKVFGFVGPPVDHDPGTLLNIGVRARNDCCIKHRTALLTNDLEVLADDVSDIRTAPEEHIDDIGNESVLMDTIRQLEGIVSHFVVGYKDLHHSPLLMLSKRARFEKRREEPL